MNRNAMLLVGAAGIALTVLAIIVSAVTDGDEPDAGNANVVAEPTAASAERTPTAPMLTPTVTHGTPANGVHISPPAGPDGPATLTIVNGTTRDAVVKLVDDDDPPLTRRAVYVEAEAEVQIEGIGQCRCTLRVSQGVDWDPASGRFLLDASYWQFKERLDFTETQTSSGVGYTDFEVTLHPVVGGDAPTEQIDEELFLQE